MVSKIPPSRSLLEPHLPEATAWWKATPYKAPEVECSRIKQQNLLSYAPGGWTSQLRIVLECAQKVGPETIALGGVRKHWRSVNGTGFPELRRKNGEAISLKIRTPGLHSSSSSSLQTVLTAVVDSSRIQTKRMWTNGDQRTTTTLRFDVQGRPRR